MVLFATWVLVGIALLMAEYRSQKLVAVFFAAGAFTTSVFSLTFLSGNFAFQLIVFLAVSLIFMASLRSKYKKKVNSKLSGEAESIIVDDETEQYTSTDPAEDPKRKSGGINPGFGDSDLGSSTGSDSGSSSGSSGE